MKNIIKHRKIVEDAWTVVPHDATDIPTGDALLLPLPLWLQHRDALATRADIGICLDGNDAPDDIPADALPQLPLIAVSFPIFTDGRGFSIGRLLRERYGYAGELRAVGHVLQDQLCYLKRCGFDSFVLPALSEPAAALAALDDYTLTYQTSVDQPEPLFRRS